MADCEELRQFAADAQELERRLRESRPEPEAVPFLHPSVMCSLAAAEAPGPVQAGWRRLRWLAVPGLVLLLGVGLWATLKSPAPPPQAQALAGLSTTLELGDTMPRTMATGLVAPLSEELDHVNADLHSTAQFLLASVP